MKLTIKQKRFADEYIISGNASDAALKAGYSKKTAGIIGHENLKKPNISQYIKKRLDELDAAKTMDLKEAIERSSAIARREPHISYSKTVDKLTGEVEREKEYIFTPSIEEAQRSLEHIIRCNGGFTDKQEIKLEVPVLFEGEDEIPD